MEKETPNMKFGTEAAVEVEIAIDVIANERVLAGGCLNTDLVRATSDEIDIEQRHPGGGTMADDLEVKFGIGWSALENSGADTAAFAADSEVIKPRAAGRKTASDERAILFPHGAGFERLAAAQGGLFIEGAKEHSRGILIEAMNQPDPAGRPFKNLVFQIIAPFKGGALLAAGAPGVGVGEDAGWFVDDNDKAVPMQNWALGDGGGVAIGHRRMGGIVEAFATGKDEGIARGIDDS
jgi:hypothetical protein